MGRNEIVRLTNMCLLKVGADILVQERTKKDWPGITYPGGHVEKGEGFKQAMIREFEEETGLRLLDPVLKGIEEFKTDDEERYLVFLYAATRYEGTIRDSSEGKVFWIKREELPKYDLSLDLLEITQVIEDDSLSALRYYREEGEWKKILE